MIHELDRHCQIKKFHPICVIPTKFNAQMWCTMGNYLTGTRRWWDRDRAYSLGSESQAWIAQGHEEVWDRTARKYQRTGIYWENTFAKTQDHEICECLSCCLPPLFSLSFLLKFVSLSLSPPLSLLQCYMYVPFFKLLFMICRCTRIRYKSGTSFLPSKQSSCFPA